MRMRAAYDTPASLLFSRAVLLRDEPEVTGDFAGAIESIHHIERRDKGARRKRWSITWPVLVMMRI